MTTINQPLSATYLYLLAEAILEFLYEPSFTLPISLDPIHNVINEFWQQALDVGHVGRLMSSAYHWKYASCFPITYHVLSKWRAKSNILPNKKRWFQFFLLMYGKSIDKKYWCICEDSCFKHPSTGFCQ